MRSKGKVKWFHNPKGFGYITNNSDQTDVFVHVSSIRSSGFRTLNEGDVVEFDVCETPKGLQATDVVLITAAEQPPVEPLSRLSGQNVLLAPERRQVL